MIKGITTVARVATEETFDQLNQLLQTLASSPEKAGPTPPERVQPF